MLRDICMYNMIAKKSVIEEVEWVGYKEKAIRQQDSKYDLQCATRRFDLLFDLL